MPVGTKQNSELQIGNEANKSHNDPSANDSKQKAMGIISNVHGHNEIIQSACKANKKFNNVSYRHA